MIYRDLLKICIYFIAIKLFVDSVSIIPEKIYTSFLRGNWTMNVFLYVCLNFLIVFLLFRINNDLVDRLFKKDNYLQIDINNSLIFRISVIICSYYIIFTTSFTLMSNISVLRIDFNILNKIISIIISLLLLLFSNTITKKTFKNE